MTQNCSQESFSARRRKGFQFRRLEMLKYLRDALERRIAAVNASIATLESQISRDSCSNENNADVVDTD